MTLVTAALLTGSASGQVVFSTDFESGLPAEFGAVGASTQGVQGYAGLGPAGRQFGGEFLRYDAVSITPVTLTLTGLPPHTHVDVDFLLALIDSWDGTEVMEIRVDSVLLFSHTFQLALGDSSSYVAPPDALLSQGTNLGFSNGMFFEHDRAYDLGVEPAFRGIPHVGSTLTVEWTIGAVSGPAADQWQGGSDESWGLDAVRVTLLNGPRGIGQTYCSPAVANSTGQPGVIEAFGSVVTTYDAVTLRASQLPTGSFGYFLASQSQGMVIQPGGSIGTLCLGGAIGRYVGPGQVQNTGAIGSFELVLSLPQTPTPTGPHAILPGETWHYQCWHRDSVGGMAVSNFTDAVSVPFQ